MKKTFIYLALSAIFVLMAVSCEKKESLGENNTADGAIVVGGVTANGLEAVATEQTKSTDAADLLSWFVKPLSKGLLIQYWKKSNPETKRMARLTLNMNGTEIDRDLNGFPIYSFVYEDDKSIAMWYGNGDHIFQGVYPPEQLREGNEPEDITTDQHIDSEEEVSLGNYTLLQRYLAMPAKSSIHATTTRISLPFSHRLARVIFYILINPDIIDPATSQRATIKGYQLDEHGKDDPTTSSIRFKSVNVLENVKIEYDSNLDTVFVPSWTSAKSVIPHFLEERGSIGSEGEVLDENNCIVYYNIRKKYYITPSNKNWAAAKAAYDKDPENCGYKKTEYGKVPCYDLIIRPTGEFYDNTGSISTNQFLTDIALSNGLTMISPISVTLDPNMQIAVYVRIDRDEVAFDSASSELWNEDKSSDDFYGVDNQEGHTLSISGSGWQRAFRIGSISGDTITDGHFYNSDAEGDGQYLSESKWVEKLALARQGEQCHGDYFILSSDITINTNDLPSPFVFTGHLDANDHKITLTGDRTYLFDGLNGTYQTAQETDITAVWEANVHKEGEYWIPRAGYRAEVLDLIVAGGTLFPDSTYSGGVYTNDVNGYVFNCRLFGGAGIPDNRPEIPLY